ncbi:2-hydroxyacid dehydrogenase [Telmatospirillum sp. J64-1]|uniref:2-hydroxyacid dehydrogenase n=1 Tax=Telmatospirillum sp. J64-1 TaxID=2502183 RepID=UPI00115F00F6|nr:2-hydroxyacid dehydrogenase [Telmatospirillum sp. J64-1]
MKIFMVGEAANHREKLEAGLCDRVRQQAEIIALPREAAHSGEFDSQISPEDIVISLHFRRNTGEAPACRLLHVPGAGLDGITFEALSPTTTVCNVFEHQGPIAEFVLASILHWEIRFDELRRSFSPDNWSEVYRHRVPHGELRGKTVGIIGFGRIGRAIGELARGFGVHLLATDANPIGPADGVEQAADLSQLLETADYVVIACPLSESTRDLIGEQEFRQMKPTGVIINISRAEIIVEEALYHALRTEQIRGASLDVWYRYPSGATDEVRPSDYPFHQLPNAICTPHSSAWTRELMERRYAVIARNVNALIAGTSLENVVRQGR